MQWAHGFISGFSPFLKKRCKSNYDLLQMSEFDISQTDKEGKKELLSSLQKPRREANCAISLEQVEKTNLISKKCSQWQIC